MVLALRWVFCVDQRTGSGLCCVQRWANVGVQLVWEKDTQFLIITIALLTQKDVTMAHCTYLQSR